MNKKILKFTYTIELHFINIFIVSQFTTIYTHTTLFTYKLIQNPNNSILILNKYGYLNLNHENNVKHYTQLLYIAS